MNQTFINITGVEHFSNLLNGFEDLVECTQKGEGLSPNAAYTNAIINLDDDVVEVIDGQEGFLDSVKRGATKVYEWIKSLIKAIKDWLLGTSKRAYEAAKRRLEEINNPNKYLEEVMRFATTYGVVFDGNRFEDKLLDAPFKRIDAKDKEIIVSAIKSPDIPLDKINIVLDDLSEVISSKTEQNLTFVIKRAEEINRIDPSKEAQGKLNINDRFLSDTISAVEKIKRDLSHISEADFNDVCKSVIKLADNTQVTLNTALNALTKLNDDNRLDDGTGRITREANITKELGGIANGLRDLVITLDSQIQKSIASAKYEVVKAALIKAKSETSESAERYIQDMINAM